MSKSHDQIMKEAREALRTMHRLLLPYQREEWIKGTIAHIRSGGLVPKPDVPDAWKPERLLPSERARAERERERALDALLEQATRDQDQERAS